MKTFKEYKIAINETHQISKSSFEVKTVIFCVKQINETLAIVEAKTRANQKKNVIRVGYAFTVENKENTLEEKIDNMLETLAAQEHAQWAKWHLHVISSAAKNENGSITIPADLVESWSRQVTTDYIDLTEKEKEADRRQARPVITLFKHALL